MHTPWLQIANEVRKVNAPQLAGELDVSVGDAYLMLSDLIKWALERCPEDRPPSASGLVKGVSASRQLAEAMGWRGDVRQLVAALEALPYGMIEVVATGIRIRGLKRYDAYWRNAYPKAAKAWVGAPSASPPQASSTVRQRNSDDSSPPDPEADPDTDPKAYQPPPTPSFEAPPPVVVVEKEIGDCWEKLQDNRERAHLKREQHRPRAFPQWYRDRRNEGHQVPQLVEAHQRYLDSKTIRAVGHPTQVFLTEGIYAVRLPDAKAEDLRRRMERIGRPSPPP